jgi:IMP dehydrogenase
LNQQIYKPPIITILKIFIMAQFPGIKINPLTSKLLETKRTERAALTFDDITLEDKPTDYHPNQVKLGTYITRNIQVKGCGILSAPMDTVTEEKLALALAKEGGIGIIHRNLDIESQVRKVKWVRTRTHYNKMISHPMVFEPNTTMIEIQKKIKEHDLTFSSFPVIDENNKFLGLITRDDMDFSNSLSNLAINIMKPKEKVITCDVNTTPEEAYQIMIDKRIKKLPVIDGDEILIGMYVWSDISQNDFCQEVKKDFYSLDYEGQFLVGAAIGVGIDELERAMALVDVGCKIIVIDTSHGACVAVKEQIKRLRLLYQNTIDIIVGNIASYESAMYLLNNKLNNEYMPDALKVGIGPGSTCTTRKVTGHGVPQITAIYEVYCATRDFAEHSGIHIPVIADGGIRCSGDMIKCFAVGASSVMLGGILAGTTESPGKFIMKNGKSFKTLRGMGSKEAMEDRNNSGSKLRYFNQNETKFVPEGIFGLAEHKGSVQKVIRELSGGVRAGWSHSGACRLKEFQKNATIWIQTVAGVIEGNPHNIENVHE